MSDSDDDIRLSKADLAHRYLFHIIKDAVGVVDYDIVPRPGYGYFVLLMGGTEWLLSIRIANPDGLDQDPMFDPEDDSFNVDYRVVKNHILIASGYTIPIGDFSFEVEHLRQKKLKETLSLSDSD